MSEPVVGSLLKEQLLYERQKLRALVHRRLQILSQQSAERNRMKQSRDEQIQELIQEAITFYQKQMDQIDKQISTLITAKEELKRQGEILNSCPGVGPATIGILMAELPELGERNRGQIAKRVGVAPIARDSGTKEGRRRTTAGQSLVRKILDMAALVSTRHNPRFKAYYEALVQRGKPKKVALVAVIRKMLITLNTMSKNQKMWNEKTATT